MASSTASPTRTWFGFPEIVDERAARTVAAFVVALSASYVVTGWWPLLGALAYGFVARVAAGPRYSPFGLIATRLVVPRLGGPQRLTCDLAQQSLPWPSRCTTCPHHPASRSRAHWLGWPWGQRGCK